MKKIYTAQSLLLLIGTLFAWFTVYTDFSRFYNLYGDITRIRGCVIPNPVTTPCFYGAFAFLGGLIWSLYILKTSKQKKVANPHISQRINIFQRVQIIVQQTFKKVLKTFIITILCQQVNYFAH